MNNPAIRFDRAPIVIAVYAALAVGMTWPLVTHLDSRVAWDMGDPVFVCWVLLWTSGQVLAALRGDVAALANYWNGNIFAPAKMTLAFSEHFTAQMLQALPIFAATGNVVLCYNLLFLSTIVFAGWGMYLLVRELTAQPIAAFVAGLAFAFAPYRISQGAHLHVLSSQWMPLVLYGFRRYFVTSRTRPLAGASIALVIQNLSCTYYLLFFAPFAGAYCLYEMADRRLFRNTRVWMSLGLAALAVAFVTWPFVAPYLAVRRSGGVSARPMDEAVKFSADVYAFGTAPLQGPEGNTIVAFTQGEGEGFPGFATVALAGTALVLGVRRQRPRVAPATTGGRIAGGAFAGVVALSIVLVFHGSLPIAVRGQPFHNIAPLLGAAALLGGLWIALSPRIRERLRGVPGSTFGFFAGATFAAALLSLGPKILSAGRAIGAGPYYLLYAFVPGFDGIRVPARYLMLVACFLAVLCGLGAAAILARMTRRIALAVLAVASIGILAESWVVPMPSNARLVARGYEFTPREIYTGREMGPLYQTIRDTPGSVLIEFPFGDAAYDIQSVYYAGYHRRPLVNGYSGFFPESYLRLETVLDHIPFDLDVASKAVASTGATHALVHEGAFQDGRGHEITDWLAHAGATVIGAYGSDKLLRLR